ncbi:MAG TPA: HAD hydrolase family protein [Ktedonobacterales bacterium]|nr:HAD hydrolase family protein [Ktedonobacterales bacterium]
MGRIRLVAADLDGTLLDPHGCITPRTRAALRRLADAGVTLALATGRRWTGGSVAAASLGFSGPLIHMDGAVIRSYPSGDVLHRSALDRRFAQRAVHAMFASGIQPIVQYSHADEEYLHVAEEAPNPQWTATYLPAFHQQIRFLPVAELCDVSVDPIRLVALAPVGVLRRVAVDIGAQGCGRQLLLHGNYGTAELTLFESNVSKGNALTILARSLGVPLAETMAIGDGPNDITMLRAAGLGVAMGQAPRRVRAVADALTAANDDDGLARAIERYVFDEPSSGGASTYL